MKIQVLIHEAEEGGFWAEAPALAGCYSQGETREEVVANIQEAIEGWFLAMADMIAERQPLLANTQVLEVSV